MDLASPFVAFLAASSLYLLGYVVYYRFLHPLAKFPGPFAASLTNLWAAKLTAQGSWHSRLAALHRQHGPIIRVGPNEVSILDIGAAKSIYTAGAGFTKTEFYRAFNDPRADAAGTANIFSSRSESFHANRRRQVGNAYSMSSLLGFREYVDVVVCRFIDHLAMVAKEKPSVNLSHELALLACDVACELAMGGGTDCIGGDRFGTLEAVEQSQSAGAVMGRLPWLQSIFFLPAVQRLAASSPVSKTFKELGALVDAQVKAHLEDPSARHDMLSIVLESAQRGSAKKSDDANAGLPFESIALETFGIILADTTSITMSALFYYILNDAKVYAKLREECDAQESPDDELPYLRAVLNETFRIHPAVSMPMPRIVPAQGAVLAGQHFRGGVHVGVNAYHLHRLSDVFGDDVETFRPERWYATEGDKADAERIKLMERTLLQFGGGAHTCIGKNISLLELKTALPALLRAFDFELLEPGQPIQIHTCWFAYIRNLNVRIKKRSS